MKPLRARCVRTTNPIRSALPPTVMLVLLLAAPPVEALFRCVDEQGVVTFRDTPCPIRPDSATQRSGTDRGDIPRDRLAPDADETPPNWLEVARIASQIRLATDIGLVGALLGNPVEQRRSGIRAHYVFELPVLRAATPYRAEIYTVNNRVTAIKDTFRHHRAREPVTPGMDYDEIVMTWGPPDDERLRRTSQGIETVLIYRGERQAVQGDRVVMLDDIVVSIQHDVRLDS